MEGQSKDAHLHLRFGLRLAAAPEPPPLNDAPSIAPYSPSSTCPSHPVFPITVRLSAAWRRVPKKSDKHQVHVLPDDLFLNFDYPTDEHCCNAAAAITTEGLNASMLFLFSRCKPIQSVLGLRREYPGRRSIAVMFSS